MAKNQTQNDLFAGMRKVLEPETKKNTPVVTKVKEEAVIVAQEQQEPPKETDDVNVIHHTKNYDIFISFPKAELKLQLLAGPQFEQLERSILDMGITTPAKVIKITDYQPDYTGVAIYMILGGHNRFTIAKKHKLDFPYIIMKNLTNAQADRIVAEEHLLNRQISDFLPSQICALLKALKYDNSYDQTNIIEKANTHGGFNFTKNTIYRYLKLDKLNSVFLHEWFDEKKMGLYSANVIASMKPVHQEELLSFLIRNQINTISMQATDELQPYIRSGNLSEETYAKIFIKEKKTTPSYKYTFATEDLLSMQMPAKDIPNAKEIIKEALRMYYQRQTELD